MKPVIYIDVLFLTNFVIDYLLLLATQKICKSRSNAWRLSAGAALGSLYAVFMFMPSLSLLYSLAAKLAASAVFVAVSFRIAKWREFVRLLITFYAVNFVFAGAAFGLFYFTDVGSNIGAAVSNGAFYFNLPFRTLILSTAVSYALVRIGYRIFAKQIRKTGHLFDMTITLNGTSAALLSFLDNGNTLSDPLTGAPVIVVEYESVNKLLPPCINDIFVKHGGDYGTAIEEIIESTNTFVSFKLIPFRSLGQENGTILAFRPDSISFRDKQLNGANALIGIAPGRISAGQPYTALLNPMIANF